MDKPQDEMDYLVKHRQYFLDQPGFPGWSGMGQPGEMERTSGFWVSKAGARFFPNGFRYDPRADAHWEWGAVLAGGLELCSGEETRRVAEGECYFMPPGRALVARPLGRPFLVWFELAGERCSKFARVCNYPLSGLSVGTLSASPLECAVHIAQALHDRPVGFSLFAQAQL